MTFYYSIFKLKTVSIKNFQSMYVVLNRFILEREIILTILSSVYISTVVWYIRKILIFIQKKSIITVIGPGTAQNYKKKQENWKNYLPVICYFFTMSLFYWNGVFSLHPMSLTCMSILY